jgi:hypothetical protein
VPDEEEEREPVQMSYKEALDYAIFAINTIMHPDATSDEDFYRLDAESDNVIATLVDLREAVQGDGHA